MARHVTGEYRIYFFDEYGERQKNARQVYAPCLTQAVTKGRRYSKLCGFHSFRVDRAVFNSLDNHRYHASTSTKTNN